MRFVPYLQFDGIELANANRTLAYVNLGLVSPAFSIGLADPQPNPTNAGDASNLACYCSVTDDGPYVDPAADGAPWYDGTSDSADFLGVFLEHLSDSTPARRTATARAPVGSTIGPRFFEGRILQASGQIFARSTAGIAFGEAWLRDLLAGKEGCASEEVRIYRACSAGSLRRLIGCGTIDGPVFAQHGNAPECYVEDVAFQIASTLPWMLTEESTEQPATTLGGTDLDVCYTASGSGVTAAKVTVTATAAVSTEIEIIAEPCGGYSDTYAANYEGTAGVSYAEFRIPAGTLQAGYSMVVDSIERLVYLLDANGRVIAGMDALDFSGAFRWIETVSGGCQCVWFRTAGSAVPASAEVVLAIRET